MEPEGKRRRTDDDDESGTEKMRKKNKSAKAEEEEEKEVEEFFAILKRIRVAVKYFQKAEKRGPTELSAATTTAWKPTFEAQDFQELVQGDSGLDLNAEPTIMHLQG